MAEYIVDCNKKLPKECEHCSPCLRFGCEHVTMATSTMREPITRCRDCVFGEIETPNGSVLSSHVWCIYHEHVFRVDEFCSKGERR